MKKLIALIIMTTSLSASAINTCHTDEHYDPSQGLVINVEYCYDDSEELDENLDDDGYNHSTVISTRLPKKGETGYKG